MKAWTRGKQRLAGLLALLCFAGILAGCAPSGAEEPSPEELPPVEMTLIEMEEHLRDMEYKVGIAADEKDRLYIGARDEILVKDPTGKDLGSITGLASCYRLTYANGLLYAIDATQEGNVLRIYDVETLEEVNRMELDLEGSVIMGDPAVAGNQLVVTVSEDAEHLTSSSSGVYFVDLNTGAVETSQYYSSLSWVLPMEDGELLLGLPGRGYRTTDLRNRPRELWWDDSQAVCRGQENGVFYACKGRSLGVLDFEREARITSLVMPENGVRMTAGSHYVYVQMTTSEIYSVPMDGLGREPSEILTLYLPYEPINYFAMSIEDYMAANPGLLIRYRVVDSYDMKTRLLAGEEDIDIVGIEAAYGEMYDYYDTGVLEDLAAYPGIQEILADERLLPGALSGLMVDGALPCVPLELTVHALKVSPNGMEKAGLPTPEEGWDWYDFYAMMDAATCDADGDGTLDGLPYMNEVSSLLEDRWPPFMMDYLVNYYDEEARFIDFDTQQFRDLMEMWKDYSQKEWANRRFEESMEWGASAYASLSQRNVSIWALGGFLDQDTYPYYFYPLPSVRTEDGSPSVYSVGSNSQYLGLYSRSQNKERAADFLAFLSSYDQKHAYDLWYDESIIYEVEAREDYTVDPNADQMMDDDTALFLERGLETYKTVLARTVMPRFSQEDWLQLSNFTASYRQGQLTLDELIAELTEKTEMMLR